MGKMQRSKGASWERAVAKILAEVFGSKVKRGIGQARSASEVADVEGTPYWVESKHHRKVNVQRALLQAKEASEGSGRIPLVVAKDNRCEPTATMYLSDFVELLKKAHPRTPQASYDPNNMKYGVALPPPGFGGVPPLPRQVTPGNPIDEMEKLLK